ncbi:valine--tRNA ligase [Candidatus Parcubacteria bacterium]|nr:valine--tRNA ligase [Candidatus Parcubacteria bacterium]
MFNLPEKFLKPYDPTSTESVIYKKWMDSGLFNPNVSIEKGYTNADAEKFSIVLPPPNVTGQMHTGHALMIAIEDSIVRYHRMTGKKTLWIPGTDHAAIATQTKVEKVLLKEEKKNRHDLGREEFMKRVHEFAQNSHDTIVNQVKSMGASVDWSREAFTLDEKRQNAVYTAFKQMYGEGLIYRKNRIVNWDPKGQTTISDDEIIHEETKGKFYYFKYSADFPITIATTRPETKVGDTAIAVHPEDKRYKDLIGQTFNIDFVGVPLEIKIIGDEEVDPEFGTGAVGVTPAHSQTDYDMAMRHDLPIKQVINEYAKMEVADEELNGKKTIEAREIIVERLRDAGLLEKEEEVDQNLSRAERTNAIIEPLPKLQWWINVNKEFTNKAGQKTNLKNEMIKAVKGDGENKGEIEILPERFEKTYYHWIENLRDWCISRQIWYGHRIPVWYKKDTGLNGADAKGDEIYVGTQAPSGDDWIQDEDTLDTWFSSGLWTFSTLGWPEETDDLTTYHPTDLLETGYDILFFWVARMILMSSYLLGQVPFKTVYLHGLVRDTQGRKISKSLGNTIDPIELNEKYGADALRMGMMVGVGPGSDVSLGEDKIKAYKKFSNKIWNASRFVLENLNDYDFNKHDEIEVNPEDQQNLEELNEVLKDVTDDVENYRLYLATEKLYHYFWHTFADKIIEESKEALNDDDATARQSKQKMLYTILVNSLKALHPFMPFITEEIWGEIPASSIKDSDIIMVAKWPLK